MPEVTDPEILKRFNARDQGQEAPPDVTARYKRGPDPLGDIARPIASRTPGFLHGASQSVAGGAASAMDLPLSLNQGKVPLPLGLPSYELPPMVGPAAGHVMQAMSPMSQLWSIIPEKYREEVRQYAAEPSQSTEQKVGKIAGDVGMAAATPGAFGMAGRAARMVGSAGLSVGMWEGAQQIASMLGTDHVWPIFLMLKHGGEIFKGGARTVGKAAEEAVEEAPKAMPKPAPAKPPPKAAPQSSNRPAPAKPPSDLKKLPYAEDAEPLEQDWKSQEK